MAATAIFIAVVTQSAFAQDNGVLEDISFASLPGGRFEVKMDFSQSPPEPTGYEIDQPARIVLDFPDVKNNLDIKQYPLSFGNAKSAVVLGSDDRTRLIINMDKLEYYQTRVEGNSFVMEVGSNKLTSSIAKANTITTKLVEQVNEYESAIQNIDFRRGESGEGKVIITLSDPSININVEQTASEVQLSFIDTQLPKELRRRLDVTDFATPVLFVSADYDGANAQISIKPQGDYDYLAYQTDTEYVVSVKKLTKQEAEERKAKFTYVGEKLSLNFQDIPVRSVLQLIADFTELNLVASDTVEGKITLRLENVPWDQALDLVLKTKGLDKRQVGNVLTVAPAAEIAEQERQALETNKQLEELAPLRTEFIQILYANAEDIFKLFNNKKGGKDGGARKSILSERGRAIVDKRTNSIILTETESKIEEFRAMIRRIDIPVRQVEIEARIVRAETGSAEDFGVRWGFAGGKIADSGAGQFWGAGGTNTLLEYSNAVKEQAFDIAQGNDPSFEDYVYLDNGLADALVADLAATPSAGDAGRFTLGFSNDKLSLLSLELSALESTGRAELVSQPKVITEDQQEAVIKSGEEIPYQVATSSGATAIAWRDAVLGLTVTPHITPDDRILMKLELNKNSLGQLTSFGNAINTTYINTNVLVNNGETVVLGGIYEDLVQDTLVKIPFFGDLPFVGRFFRKTSNSDAKIEILLFVTPRILSDPLANR
ncbi:MAG: type IV pilus secretin PilQ [Pseudomonadales bacterium]|nr:type IV pilus secretin PilQ [Pseudomonadales bacterium]